MPTYRYNINGVNVQGVLDLSFGSGAAKRSNPQRPTAAWGSGNLVINGYRTKKRQTIKVYSGSVLLLDGWIQNEKYDDVTNISRYDIEGLINQNAFGQVGVTQTNTPVNANASSVTNLLRDSLGQTAMDVSLRQTPLSIYSYTGGAAGYASRFGLIAGGLPYSTNVGRLGIKDPTLVPETLDGTFGTDNYRIAEIVTEFDSEQIWNCALVRFRPVSRQQGEDEYRSNGQSGVTVDTDSQLIKVAASFSVGTLSAGQTASMPSVTLGVFTPSPTPTLASGVSVIGTNGSLGHSISDVSISGSTINYVINIPYVSTRSGGYQTAYRLVLRDGVDFSISYLDFGWHETHGFSFYTSGGRTASTGNATFASDFAWTLQQPDKTLQATNQESIDEWDERVLDMDAWFAPTAQSAMQIRIDNLAQPRNLHTVHFYLDQRDATKDAAIAALQSGMYIALPSIGKTVFIMHSQLRMPSRASKLKILTCIEAEALPDSAPSTPSAPRVSSPSESSIIASWTPPFNGGQPITRYDVRFRTGSDSWTVRTNVTSPYTISSLQSSTTYEVQVRATNSVDTSGWSPSGRATTQAPGLAAPGIPINFTGTALSDTSIQWRWGAPVSGGAVESYTLRWNESGTDRSDAIIVTGITGTGHVITGLTPNTTYEARVRAVNDTDESAQVDWTSATTLAAPPAGPDNPVFIGSSSNPVYIGSTSNRVGIQ